MTRSSLIAFLTFLACLVAAPSAAANFIALENDPPGDSADPHPGRDIVKVGLSYDRRTGHIRGGVMLRGTPSGDAPANLTLFAGHRTETGCNGYPAIGFGTQTDLTAANWVMLRSPSASPVTGRAEKLYTARAEEYEATTRQLAGNRPNCVVAQLNEPGNTAKVYDVAGPYKLRGLPELRARLGKVPSKMKPGKTRKVRVKLRNPGDAATGRLRLSVSSARGLKVRMPRSVGSIRPGSQRTVALRVTLSRRAATHTTLRLTAKTGNGLRARAEDELYLYRRPSNTGGGKSSSTQLCYRYHWLPPYSKLVAC